MLILLSKEPESFGLPLLEAACCLISNVLQHVSSPAKPLIVCTSSVCTLFVIDTCMVTIQVGSQAVISGIAQRALTVIREAAAATGSSQYSSSNAFSASTDGQDPAGNMAGGSASIYSQGPQKGSSGPAGGAAANTPAMPSMSGANAASVYADKFSDKPSGRQNGSKSLFETITGKSKSSLAASGISHNATAAEPKSDNMGGGSSAIYSQGPRKQTGDGQDNSDSKKGANTPAMPSMSGANAASDYSESNKKKNLTGKGTQQGPSLYETITGKKDSGPKQQLASGRSNSSASSSRDSPLEQQSSKGGRRPKETPEDPSSSMGGGSSSIFSQVSLWSCVPSQCSVLSWPNGLWKHPCIHPTHTFA